MPRLPFISFLNFLLAALLVTTASADAVDHHALHVVRSDAQSLIVELRLPAQAAAQAGARVIIADERAQMGGQLLASSDQIGGQAGSDWAAEVTSDLATRADCEVLTRTTAALFGDHNFVVLSQRVTGHVDAPEGNHVPRERIWKVRAR